MKVNIGMKRDKLVAFANEILANCLKSETEGNDYVETVTLYAKDNNTSREVIININNDDMERDEVSLDEVYVEVER